MRQKKQTGRKVWGVIVAERKKLLFDQRSLIYSRDGKWLHNRTHLGRGGRKIPPTTDAPLALRSDGRIRQHQHQRRVCDKPKAKSRNNIYKHGAQLCYFGMEMGEFLQKRYQKLMPLLDERSRRLVAAADCVALGRGGLSAVSSASGISRPTLYKGIDELEQPADFERGKRIRKPGGGRKKAVEKFPGLEAALEGLVEPTAKGDPMSALRWTTKSVRHLSDALKAQGYPVSHRVVAETLHTLGYSLQANAKNLEQGSTHPDRDAQFAYINAKAEEFRGAGHPVISVDTKKKELVSDYKNQGREWRPKGSPAQVKVHDFIDREKGKAIPYGIYDLEHNQGWFNVGCDHDTSAFAVESIRGWWNHWGQELYSQAGAAAHLR